MEQEKLPGIKIGVISDTHGLLRPEAVTALAGSDYIVHAGDIGSLDIADSLAEIAPLTAVRGNTDKGAWAAQFPLCEVLEVGSVLLYILHDIEQLDLDPKAAGLHAVISGHSHQPAAYIHDGVLYLNPGSAGPRRFRLPVAVAQIEVSGTDFRYQLLELDV